MRDKHNTSVTSDQSQSNKQESLQEARFDSARVVKT